MTELISYLFVTLRETDLENVSFSDMLNLRGVVNSLTSDAKSNFFVIVRNYSNQFKCNYLKKQKTLSQFLAPFLKSTSNFEDFEKKDDPHS